MGTEGKSCSLHHNFLYKVSYISSRTQQGVWWGDNCAVLSTTSLWDGKQKQWRHLIVPETQPSSPAFLDSWVSEPRFKKLILRDEGTKVQREALRCWNLQYWFQTDMGLLFEAWKGNGALANSALPWLGGKNNNNISSSKHFHSTVYGTSTVVSTLSLLPHRIPMMLIVLSTFCGWGKLRHNS